MRTLVMAALLSLPLPPSPWTELPAPPASAGGGYTPGIAFDSQGRTVLAWSHDVAGNSEIYVQRWTGSAWEELGGSATGGGISDNPGTSSGPVVRVDALDRIVVAWIDNSFLSYEVYLKRWNGTAWEELEGSATAGGLSATSGTSTAADLELDAAGNPVVVWSDNTPALSNYEVYLRRWSGTSWEELAGSATGGGISASAISSANTSLAIDTLGFPVVAWSERFTGNYEIFVKRWNGSAWTEVGGSATAGGVSATPGLSSMPSVVVDPAGRIVVAWQDTTPANSEIYAKRWNGAAWTELGGSAGGGGISATVGVSMMGGVAIAPSGEPVIAWWDFGTNYEIDFKRFDGSAWVGLDGSATGGGLSNSAGADAWPCVATDPAGRPVVAWQEYDGSGMLLHLVRWDGVRVSSLEQLEGDETTPIPTGGAAPDGTVVIRAVVEDDLGGPAALEVEVRPLGDAFTGSPTAQSAPVASGATASIRIEGLASGDWHWRARAAGSLGVRSGWLSFGANPEGSADFTVPAPPNGGTPGTTGGKGRPKKRTCGGSAGGPTSALAVLGLLAILPALVRRRGA